MARLEDVDLEKKLSGKEGVEQLQALQRRLLALRLQAAGLIGDPRLGPPLCVVFEGWDASGKGGAIRRLTGPLDPRHVRVEQFAAPTEREKRHHFLWRFWPVLPGWGGMVVSRSILVRPRARRARRGLRDRDRVGPRVWRDRRVRADAAGEGMVLVKCWLHISENEQLKRYRARERDPLKRWKLTDEDWRNLAHRAGYERAVDDMLRETDHEHAPWNLIAAENKPWARVQVLDCVIDALEAGLRAAGQEPLDVQASL